MSELILDAFEWFCDGAGVIVSFAAILVALAFFLYKDEQSWQKFSADHHCRVIRETRGQTIVTSDGKTAYISGTTTWACDDGKEYTR